MNIVVPMAGMGKRMRPHTLTVPKPLIPIAGKPIVQRLVEDIAALCSESIDEIAFIIGDFGDEVEAQLLQVAESLGAKGKICYQEEPLGTAHAILCAADTLNGPTIVAFADTLFRADFKLDTSKDGVLWVKQIPNPQQFGVVVTDDQGNITEFVEKPEEFVSDLAMIGIYFFGRGEVLREECQWLIDNNVINGGEYQLPDALRNMTQKGMSFAPGEVSDWMDCGNKNATVETNGRILGYIQDNEETIAKNAQVENSVIIEPCYIGEGAVIRNSVIGPRVSVGAGTVIENSRLSDAVVQNHSTVRGAVLENSMVGHHAHFEAQPLQLSISDYSTQGK